MSVCMSMELGKVVEKWKQNRSRNRKEWSSEVKNYVRVRWVQTEKGETKRRMDAIVYITRHLLGCGSGPPSCVPLSVSPNIASNAFATFALCLALTSIHAALSCCANCLPSASETCLWTCKSLFWPTMRQGTDSVPV